MTEKVTYRIHYTLPDGTEDAVIVEGETIEDVRYKAEQEIAARNATNPWSEEL